MNSGEGKIEQPNLYLRSYQRNMKRENYVIAGGDWNQTLVKGLQVDSSLLTEWIAPTVEWDSLPNWGNGVDPNAPTNRALIKPYVGNKDKLAKFFIDGLSSRPISKS